MVEQSYSERRLHSSTVRAGNTCLSLTEISTGIEKNSTFARCTPFALFVFFILGPCEHLIPLMSFGGGDAGWFPGILVLLAFCLTTILTMLICVMFFYYGVSRFSIILRFENYMHAATGLILFVCGCAIQFHGH